MQGIKQEKTPLTQSLATEVNEAEDFTTNINQKIERYSRARERATNIIAHVDTELQKTGMPYLESVRDGLIECGNYLHFRAYPTVQQTRLHNANFCKKHLFCPLCAIRRASKSLSSYLERYKVIRAQKPHLVPYMATLTVRNGHDLDERYNHLVNSLKKLTRNRTRALTSKTSRHTSEFAKIDGAVGSYEFTERGNGWHPHVHIIALVNPKDTISQQALSQEWLKATGDSFIVDVRPIGDPDDPIKGFVEVFKYALKFSDLSYQQQIHAALTLKSRRLLFSIGSFRGVQVPESLTDEPLDELPFVDLLYRFIDGQGYVLKEVF